MTTVTYDFSGKRALVTGAGRGIGRAVAKALAESGAVTYALSKTKANLDSLVNECPGIKAVCVDLTDWDATRKAVTDIGPIDLLVNNAGVLIAQPFLDVQPESFDTMLNVNVKAAINVSQLIVRGMLDRKLAGSIVNVSSQGSVTAKEDISVYSASKAALNQITRTMALELGPHNIRVNSVNPTVVLTDMGRALWADPAKAERMTATIPLGRFAGEEEIVKPIMFLLSDDASMIHGAVLAIDGGSTVQ